MDSAWGTALIALSGTLVGAALSLFGGIWQQKRNEKATEANRRTVLREASLDRITEELFAIVRLGESVPSSDTSAEDHTAWERTLREHLTRIEMASLRLENPLRATINDMCSLLLNDRDRLAPMAWPYQVVTGATRHAIDSIGAFQRGETLPDAGRSVQRLRAARERADEDEREAEEETRRNSSP
ncbi:hypothetical protein [Streptomyces sp. NPDC101455]|uniref:hypothetical protein n=1 Tax=Streptomyces sp. NPDC101455 TaxID=3366142 RepID=UPI003827D186